MVKAYTLLAFCDMCLRLWSCDLVDISQGAYPEGRLEGYKTGPRGGRKYGHHEQYPYNVSLKQRLSVVLPREAQYRALAVWRTSGLTLAAKQP